MLANVFKSFSRFRMDATTVSETKCVDADFFKTDKYLPVLRFIRIRVDGALKSSLILSSVFFRCCKCEVIFQLGNQLNHIIIFS